MAIEEKINNYIINGIQIEIEKYLNIHYFFFIPSLFDTVHSL